MTRWLAQHTRSLGRSLTKLARAPVANLLNVLVLAVALAVPTGLYVALSNLQNAARAASPEPQLTMFLALDAGAGDVRELQNRLKAHPAVAQFRFVPRAEALEQLERASGMSGLIEGLPENPLPDAFVIDARDAVPAALQRLQDELAAWPNVAQVQLDSQWAQRLDAVIRFGRIAFLLLGSLLAFALVAITFNTIRLQVLTQREEIEVAKLIGATDASIRRPFLYYGALLGLLGALAAWGFSWFGLRLLNDALTDLSYLYGASWQLRHLDANDTASLLAFAAGLGWLGAWLCVARHLAAAAPR